MKPWDLASLSDEWMFCCECQALVKRRNMFVRRFNGTAICLCKKCTKKFYKEIKQHLESEVENNAR